MAEKFIIHWLAEATDYKGHGTAAMPKADAQTFCDALNRTWAGVITHWIEPVGAAPAQTTEGAKQ